MRYYLHWHNVRYELAKSKERLLLAIVWRMPKVFVKWCYIRVATHATTGEYSDTVVPDLTMLEALERW